NLAYTVATACSAGNYAITLGYDLIQEGKAKTAFCGGVDSFSQAIFAGFNRLFIVSPDKCRPFDKNRNGMIIAEGAGVLILEDMDTALARGARIYSEVLGYGVSCGAHNLVSPTKNGIKLAMKRAVKNSGLTNKDIDYINAHGTATPNNDRNEAKAIRELFGPHAEKVAVSSNKSVLGHALSAASIFEAVSCCLSIRDEIIPPTMNYETPDPECRLNIIANKHKKKKINIAMNNSFAFGGNNACVIFGRLKTRGKKCRRA
ncbi:MAG: beta-ketoacyl-[acyl-carrier-protein] synthase family protein, partial [Candidatus Aadella gelida]|nr:beta-ketoacyl-[acyl-carrier-protein] synthase family protein [Candidatus Aadella gelida]